MKKMSSFSYDEMKLFFLVFSNSKYPESGVSISRDDPTSVNLCRERRSLAFLSLSRKLEMTRSFVSGLSANRTTATMKENRDSLSYGSPEDKVKQSETSSSSP
jgi:hypothetical protein